MSQPDCHLDRNRHKQPYFKSTMDFVNQHNAWIGTLISAFVGTGSLIIAFISNREKVYEFVKKSWPGITVLFALFGLWSLYEFGAWTYLMRLWLGLLNLIGFRIPIWAIFVAIVFAIGVRWIFRLFINRRGHELTHQLSPDDFRVEDYIEDLIDGVWWHWTYSGNKVNVPKPICPNSNCQCDLFFREDWMRLNCGPNVARIGRPPVSLHCPRCNFRMDFNKVEEQVLYDVTQEILSQIRTNRFRGRLYNRALNKQSGQG